MPRCLGACRGAWGLFGSVELALIEESFELRIVLEELLERGIVVKGQVGFAGSACPWLTVSMETMLGVALFATARKDIDRAWASLMPGLSGGTGAVFWMILSEARGHAHQSHRRHHSKQPAAMGR